MRLKLAAAILGANGFERELQNLIDAQFPIAAILEDATDCLERLGRTTLRNSLPGLESRLASSEDPHLRLLAFQTLLVQARDPRHWDAARCDRLSSYRRDSAPLVAIRAQFFFDADSALRHGFRRRIYRSAIAGSEKAFGLYLSRKVICMTSTSRSA